MQIKELLSKGKLWDKIVLEELDKKHVGDIKAKEVLFLCSLGRLVKNKKPYSFNVLVLAPSSAGKDNLVESVIKLFPEEDYEIIGRISPKVLNYLHNKKDEPNFSWNGKILVLPEIEENVLNNEVMKVFTSSEGTKTAITIDKKATIFETTGNPCVFSTTATTSPVEEIRNRFNIIGLDLSEEQIKATFSIENEEYSKEIKAFLGSLKPFEVEIPEEMKKFIIKAFCQNNKLKQRHKRDFPKLLDWIRAVALFHQDERRGHTTETIRAEAEDCNIAKEVFMNAFSGVSDIPLKEIDRRIVEVLEREDKPLTAQEICAYLEGFVSIQNLYPHLRDLKFKEIIDEITDRGLFDRPTTKYLLSIEYKDKKPFKLPNYEEE